MDGITTAEGIKSDASANTSTEMQEASVSASSYACGHPAAVEAKVRANFSISMMITFCRGVRGDKLFSFGYLLAVTKVGCKFVSFPQEQCCAWGSL